MVVYDLNELMMSNPRIKYRNKKKQPMCIKTKDVFYVLIQI